MSGDLTAGQRAALAAEDGGRPEHAAARGVPYPSVKLARVVRDRSPGTFAELRAGKVGVTKAHKIAKGSAELTEIIEREETAPAVALNYDYEQLEPEQRAPAMHAACQIKLAAAVTVSAVLTIGRELSEVKEMLPHGQYLDWLKAEFEWTDQTARNYLSTFETFGSNPKHVLDLKNASLGAVFVLARRSTPAEIRDQALTLLAKGQRLTRKLVIEMLAVPEEAELPPKAKNKKAPAALPPRLQLVNLIGSASLLLTFPPEEVAEEVGVERDEMLARVPALVDWLTRLVDSLETTDAREAA